MSSFMFKIRQLMQGRNGLDKLNILLGIIYLLLGGAKSLLRMIPKAYIALTVVQLCILAALLFRFFSKNLQKRYDENVKLEQLFKAWKPYIERTKLRFKYIRTHRFRTCRGCGEFLRLKKGFGKRKIVCPKCAKENTFHFLF